MIPLRRARRRRRPAPPTPPALTVSSQRYGAPDTGSLETDLAAARARADQLATDLAAARAELAVRPPADPILRRLALDGPATVETLAAELGLPEAQIAARLGHASAAGIVDCVDHPAGFIWSTRPPRSSP